MHLYFAGGDKELLDIPEADRFLQSYWALKSRDFPLWFQSYKEQGKKLFLDSGAFTAFTQGINIDIDKYIAFIQENQADFEVYAALDVIGDYNATMANLKHMEEAGIKPLPTFHYGSPLEELKKLVDKYDYMALGGLVPLALDRAKLENWLDKCFSIIRTKTKIHGFGVNALWAWLRYPFYSVDATSWLSGGKFRRIIEFKDGKFITVGKNDKEMSVMKYMTHMSDYKELNKHNVLEYLKAKEYATKVWTERGVIWN